VSTNCNCLHRFLLFYEYDPWSSYLDVHATNLGVFINNMNRSNIGMGASILNNYVLREFMQYRSFFLRFLIKLLIGDFKRTNFYKNIIM
jgi:hypothetical protein